MTAVLPVLLAGCAHSWVYATDVPGELSLPQGMDRVAVVDRTDTEAGRAAVTGFSGAVLADGGFGLAGADAVAAALAGDAASVLTEPVGPASALAMCARAGVDGMVTVHTVEADPFWNFERTDSGAWIGNYNARARAGWRVWDCAGRRVLDVETEGWFTRSAEGADRPAARAAIAADAVASADVGAAARSGEDLAEKLLPTEHLVMRTVFVGGGLRPGVRALEAGDLAAAEDHFTRATATLDPRRRARALHDLAVLTEAQGDVERALRYAADALSADFHPATVALRASLMRRAALERRR